MDNINNINAIQNITGILGNNMEQNTDLINAVYCTAGVGADTALLIDDTITTIESMYNFRSGASLPTYALSNQGTVIESHMMSIPMDNVIEKAQTENGIMTAQSQMNLDSLKADSQFDKFNHGMKKLYTDEFYVITFDNNFHISCTEATQFLSKKEDGTRDWKHAKDLKVGSALVGEEIGDEAKIDETEVRVTSIKFHKSVAAEPVYIFMCEHQNILLPSIKDDKLCFVCVKQ